MAQKNPEINVSEGLMLHPTVFPVLGRLISERRGLGASQYSSKASLVAAWLAVVSPLFKHRAFEAEAELRKIISKDYRNMPGQRFRQGRSTLIPYVEIMLDIKREGATFVRQAEYFIKEVVIGPTPNPPLTMEAVSALFATEGHPEVVVKASRIPYRSW